MISYEQHTDDQGREYLQVRCPHCQVAVNRVYSLDLNLCFRCGNIMFDPQDMLTDDQKLAQWKVERGRDLDNWAGASMIATLVTVPFALLLVAPVAIFNMFKGKKLRKEGEAEGGKELARRRIAGRGSESLAPSDFEAWRPDGRYGAAPFGPPAKRE